MSALLALFDAANQALHHFRRAIDDYLILITYKGETLFDVFCVFLPLASYSPPPYTHTPFSSTHLTPLPPLPWRLPCMRLDIHAARRPQHYKVNYSPARVIINNCQREGSPKTTPWKEPRARQVGRSWVCCKTIPPFPRGDALLKTRIMHGGAGGEPHSHIFRPWKIKMSPPGAFKHTFTTELKVLEYE